MHYWCLTAPGYSPDNTWLIEGQPAGVRDAFLWITFSMGIVAVCGVVMMNYKDINEAVWRNYEQVFEVTPAEMSELQNAVQSDCLRIH